MLISLLLIVRHYGVRITAGHSILLQKTPNRQENSLPCSCNVLLAPTAVLITVAADQERLHRIARKANTIILFIALVIVKNFDAPDAHFDNLCLSSNAQAKKCGNDC
jgi:hypothetical protein